MLSFSRLALFLEVISLVILNAILSASLFVKKISRRIIPNDAYLIYFSSKTAVYERMTLRSIHKTALRASFCLFNVRRTIDMSLYDHKTLVFVFTKHFLIISEFNEQILYFQFESKLLDSGPMKTMTSYYNCVFEVYQIRSYVQDQTCSESIQ